MGIERLLLRDWMPVAFLVIAGFAMGLGGLPQTMVVVVLLPSLAVGAVLTFFRPGDMLGLLAISVPLQAYGAVDVAGANITFTKLCVTCLLIGWLPRVAMGRRVYVDSVVWGYAAVAVALGISIAAAPDIAGWVAELYRWIVAAFVFVVARTEITERSHVNRLILGVSIGVIGVSVFAVQQVFTASGPPSFVVNGLLRAYGTFGQPNPLAAYLEMSLPILLAMAILPAVNRIKDTSSPFLMVAMAIAIAAGTLTIFLTQSRGGWIGIGAAGVFLVGSLPSRVRLGVLAGVSAALAGLFLLGWGSVLTERFVSVFAFGGERVNVSPQNWANEERRAHWGAALNMVRTHPWTGIGAGGFNDAYREYTSEWRFRLSRGHAHNGYLHMAAQAGVAGVAAFTFWIGSILLTLMRTRWSGRRSNMDGRAVGGLATIVAFSVHSMVDYLNVLSLGIQFALVIAIAMASFSTENQSAGEGTD